MCAMSCGYTTILCVYPACLYGAILRRIDNSQNLRRHQSPNRMRKRSKVAKVGSKPRVHARVVAIGSPPRYAPTGPPSGVCSNVEKARHAAGVERRHHGPPSTFSRPDSHFSRPDSHHSECLCRFPPLRTAEPPPRPPFVPPRPLPPARPLPLVPPRPEPRPLPPARPPPPRR